MTFYMCAFVSVLMHVHFLYDIFVSMLVHVHVGSHMCRCLCMGIPAQCER